MYTLKTLSKEAIPSALSKAEHYRLLNEPYEAESICLDILEVDPTHQQALIVLLLARTDLFRSEIEPVFSRAMEILERLSDDHCRSYYSGIIYERRAKAHLESNSPGAGQLAHGWFTKAMDAYAHAMSTCSPGNQDAVLRWNTCARILNKNPEVEPVEDTSGVQLTDSWE
jgi:hypothetical protein